CKSSPRQRRLLESPLKGGNTVVSRRQGRSHHQTKTLHLDRDEEGGETAAVL
ncbi:hypothetical protein A2U01_0075535, partial [Trifolium medium]|nr:hypothetical protein [Trifolium medium]